MSRRIINQKKIITSEKIMSNNSGLLKNYKISKNNLNKATIETSSQTKLRCICNKNISHSKKINLKKNINNYSSDEKQIRSAFSENITTINTTISHNSLQFQTTETEDREIIKQRGELRGVIGWSINELLMQVMERLQYLAAGPPEPLVQFPDQLMINRTINNNPIKILIPIPDYYIQQQDHFEVLSKEVIKVAEVIKEVIKLDNLEYWGKHNLKSSYKIKKLRK